MANFIEGKQYYYVATEGSGYRSRLRCGTLIRMTPKCCVLEVTMGQRKMTKRKAQKYVFETENEALAVLIKTINNQIFELYNLGILDIAMEYQTLVEQYPERFI